MNKIRPEVVNRRIESFAKRFGKAHLYLAYHAAFPLALTPDLLYRLWANFQRDIHGEVLNIPWVAVADLLLSNLCDEVGNELYQMDLALRNLLLSRLQEDKNFGQQRINELSNFLLEYVRQKIQSDDPDIQDFAQTQRWVALAYTRPTQVAHELALAFSKLDHKNKAELLRMSSLTETFAEPLTKFQPLLIYARGIRKFALGNLEAAKSQLGEVLEAGDEIQAAGISLPIPEQIQTKLLYKPDSSFLPTSVLFRGIISLLIIGSGIWNYIWQSYRLENNSTYITWSALVGKFSEVNNVPSGKFIYTGERDGTWSFILKQQVENNNIENYLINPKPEVKAEFNYEPVVSINVDNLNQPLEEVAIGKKDFAITSLVDKITDKLEQKPVINDGLLVYVAFNKKDSNLANALQGQITLEQLRQIYTGKITNWQQINSNLPNLEIKPFAPTEPEAIQKFQEIVLKNNPQDKALFAANVEKLDTTKTQNQIRREILEGRNTGIIGFGIIAKTWAQCTGYPLAIVDGNKPASQPLFQRRERRPINTADDLCQHDNYFFDVNTFQSYPLRYPIFVVYPNDKSRQAGSTFAEILTTRQGQCLLSKVGLVPLQPIPYDIRSYACNSAP
ncbi:substrate-binding domain-containing protein [Nostoc sp. 106C]|uniref:PstS family phosphate ABC transporter substrate-binding protein n=1 Tax=Nostoc sp. 106C TaxID=1932667 RepID=UPI000B72A2E1|nr:substrate-binding domain-containing protein [Nostoc sp. 106C]OUL25574.1 hypothetical protein BV375_22635 [Nostoc sp. 106C]